MKVTSDVTPRSQAENTTEFTASIFRVKAKFVYTYVLIVVPKTVIMNVTPF
jgi:hypothetical protein